MVYRQTFSAANYSPVFQYNYHTGGNISAFSDGTYSSTYSYDNLGQLIRENNPAANKTWVWTYDNAGNITSRKEYAYTTATDPGTVVSTVNYTYGNANWKDLLTAYNGQTISYDTIGNPTSMLGWSYTWEHGRQLASMTGNGTTWSFDYNADGMRYRRSNGSTTYTYYYNGDMLRYLDINGTKLYFVLDADGQPIEVSYKPANSTTTSFYFYVHNLMGDVMAILDTSGNAVVKYTYDAWGNILSTTGSMASTLGQQNPFRYRSYVYDQETGLYYLQSRYYNPVIGRWINADDTEYLGADGTLLSYNLFAYCKNNPVMGYDPTGHFSWSDVFNTAAVVTIAALAVIAIVGSGGAAAPPLLAAASALAGTTVTAAAATTVATGVAITGVATMGAAATASVMEATSNNGSSQSDNYVGKSLYNKEGERIDLEYYGNGNGNIHYQGTKGKEIIWRLADGVGKMYTVSKAVEKIISSPPMQKAIFKGIDIVFSLAGLK